MSGNAFDVNALGLAGEAVEPVAFVMLDFEGDPKFLHTSLGIIAWGGEDWYGIGNIGRIDPISDRLGYAPARFRLSLSPVAEEYLSSSLQENTWGRLCELYAGSWDPDNASLYSDPGLLIRGRMGPPEIVVGGPNSGVSVVVEDIRALLDRVNGLRATMADHQLESAGDTFYEWLPKMLDHRFVFNGGQYGGNNITPAPPFIPLPGWGTLY